MWSRNNQARIEKMQERVDAGVVSAQYPDVASIVISMMYRQKGIAHPISRTMNYSPGSYAFFKVGCLNRDCADGGFDMTRIIASMVSSHAETSKGELGCDDNGARPDHAAIVYEVDIQYM